MFVSTAYAQGAEAQGTFGFLIPMILIFVVFYFLLIRPQQKKQKEHREMLTAIRRGDRIVTGGGITGVVTKVLDDREVQLEIAKGVRVKVQRALIASVMAKTEPAGKEAPAQEAASGGGDASQPVSPLRSLLGLGKK